ncbi:uncharacterized protein LOC122510802 [Leptopilina heterotoma]|uniref:uncharacterized protein LOC122510802 n=1 Tax=Leptopilina heterotoma TaxID=63436 RepID=UPI001CA8375A|nr:uncharacterized protein LOC122510802 [Leptopilina heterotoma]
MAKLHTGISLIQEPLLVRGVIRGLGGAGLVCYRDCRAAKPRTCILTKGVNATPLLDLCSGDLMVVVTNLEGIGWWTTVWKRDPPLLLGCDANSQHTVWGSSKDNQSGQELLEYLIGTNLDILNTGSTPTFSNVFRQEVIDITLCSKSIENKIVFEVESAVRSETKWIRNPRRTDWASYISELRRTLSGLPGKIRDYQTLDEAANDFTKAIKAAYESSCKPTKVFSGKEVCWWNERLEHLRRETRRLFKRAKKRRTTNGWSDFTKMRDDYRNEVRKAKQDSWNAFCSSMKKGKETARLDKLLAKNPDAILGTLMLPDGTFSESDDGTLACLVQEHFPGFSRSGEGTSDPEPPTNLPQDDYRSRRQLANRIVTAERIRWATESFSPYKSPGPDGVYPVLLQRAIDEAVGPLVRLARASLTLGYVPIAWRGTKVVFIPKAGKNGYTSPKDFRPISLTSFILKLVERLVDRYIRSEILERFPLQKDQYAYRAGCSTETALARAVDLIDGQLQNQGFAVGVFMDIEGAFSQASPESIKRAMTAFNIPTGVETQS